jgi:hypothetical protein
LSASSVTNQELPDGDLDVRTIGELSIRSTELGARSCHR